MPVNLSFVNYPAVYKDVKYKITFLKSDEHAFSMLETLLHNAPGYLYGYHKILVNVLPRLLKKSIVKSTIQNSDTKAVDYVRLNDKYYTVEDYNRVRDSMLEHNESIITEKKSKVIEISGMSDWEDVLNHYNVYLSIHDGEKDSIELKGSEGNSHINIKGYRIDNPSRHNKIIGGVVKNFTCPDFHLHNLTIQNVLFENCTIEFDFFDSVKMKNCKFVNCDITINPRWSSISSTSFTKTIVRMDDFGGISFKDSCTYSDFECIIEHHISSGFRYKLPPDEYVR